jgi:hypothetical protein
LQPALIGDDTAGMLRRLALTAALHRQHPDPEAERIKVVEMKKSTIAALLMIFLVAGCAGMADKSRMEAFGQVAETYERALRLSDYNMAAKFLDPSASSIKPDLPALKNIRIVDYKITRIQVSQDKQQITQDVELQYFRINSNILHTARDSQIWRYDPADEVWRLHTGLPRLGPR